MIKNWIGLFLAVTLLVSCLPKPEETLTPRWTYADLRLFDPPGDADPALDLIAVYIRTHQSEFQIRLDLLDLSPQTESDIYLALDTRPGGSSQLPGGAQTALEWDVLAILPASGPAMLQAQDGDRIASARMRIVRDPTLDTITASFESQSFLPHALFSPNRAIGVQIFTAPPGSAVVADTTEPVRSDGLPPARLPVLIAFWNTLPAVTPAQALRGWNGAHTGPHNTRHGLRSVIQAVERSGVLVVLLDLKAPETLSSLDTLEALPKIRKLAEAGLLILPEVAPIVTGVPGQAFAPPGWVFEKAIGESRRYSTAFGLPASPFLYLPSLSGLAPLDGYAQDATQSLSNLISNQYRFLFTRHDMADPSIAPPARLSPWRWQGVRVLSFPGSAAAPQQVDDEGITLELRQALAAAAIENEPEAGRIFLLGGDLSRSAWGEPQAAINGLQYLAAHPWIQPVTGYNLMTARQTEAARAGKVPSAAPAEPQPFPLHDTQGKPASSGLFTSQLQDRLLAALRASPPGPLTETAWRAYLALLSPAVPEMAELQTMRANYLGQIGHLLAAARWETDGPEAVCRPSGRHPASSPCLADLDWDGQEEIILANQRLFAILEKEGGILTYGFARGEDGVHQVFGPSSQFTVGLGDPTFWRIEYGIASDPGQFPGALADIVGGYAEPAWGMYEATLSENRVLLAAPDGSLVKTIQLTPRGWQIAYTAASPIRVQIPLVIDPWLRFTPGWGDLYLEKEDQAGWSWGIYRGPQVRVETSGGLLTQTFSRTRQAIREPEDPNYAYPTGHYLPFPMALAWIQGEGEFEITITVHP